MKSAAVRYTTRFDFYVFINNVLDCTCINAYSCGNCECIDLLRRCDGVQDCDTVEIGCGCEDDQFTCNNGNVYFTAMGEGFIDEFLGTCIEPSQLCDGSPDCREGEDEQYPTCGKRKNPAAIL